MELTNKNINFFKPVGEFMTRDVRMKRLILLVWFFGNFGMLFALRFFADDVGCTTSLRERSYHLHEYRLGRALRQRHLRGPVTDIQALRR